MERLTEWYDNGLREGVLVKEKRGEKETKVLFEEIDDGYHAMCVLKNYEDTGLTPEQIREIDRLYAEKCREVAELRQRDIAKEPQYEGDGYHEGDLICDTWICPNCGERYEVEYDIYDFCPKCGQRILRGRD